MANVTRKVNKTGTVSYVIRIKDGRDHRLVKTWHPKPGTSQKNADAQAWKYADKLERDFRAGLIMNHTDEEKAAAAAEQVLTFKKYCEECYLLGLKISCKDTTISSYRMLLKNHAYPKLGEQKIDKISAAEINRLLTEFQASHAYASAIRLHAVLMGVFKAACADGTLNKRDNPMLDVLRPRRPKNTVSNEAPPMLNPDQIRRFLQAFDKDVEDAYALPEDRQNKQELIADAELWRAYFTLLFFTGLRRGEACALQWKDIDFEKGEMTVRRNLCLTKEDGVFVSTPKNGKQRIVALAPKVLHLLAAQKAHQQANRIVTPWVFTADNKADHLYPTSPTKYLSHFCRRHKLEHAWPHMLRHTFSSLAYQQTGDIVALAHVLGHSNPAFTLKVYSHTDEEAKRQTVTAFANVIGE